MHAVDSGISQNVDMLKKMIRLNIAAFFFNSDEHYHNQTEGEGFIHSVGNILTFCFQATSVGELDASR